MVSIALLPDASGYDQPEIRCIEPPAYRHVRTTGAAFIRYFPKFRLIFRRQLSVFLVDYGQSGIRGAASNEEISPSACIASYRKSDS
jgi:hypothetical protein